MRSCWKLSAASPHAFFSSCRGCRLGRSGGCQPKLSSFGSSGCDAGHSAAPSQPSSGWKLQLLWIVGVPASGASRPGSKAGNWNSWVHPTRIVIPAWLSPPPAGVAASAAAPPPPCICTEAVDIALRERAMAPSPVAGGASGSSGRCGSGTQPRQIFSSASQGWRSASLMDMRCRGLTCIRRRTKSFAWGDSVARQPFSVKSLLNCRL
mmetsp:Transcript_89802/g.231867  ORF Transcript_89802/g.231867 Transcript_89802/m.231867 type:complete len:208 (-) Transcript_89802:2062-2685(-)